MIYRFLLILPLIISVSACAEFPMIATQNDLIKVEEKVSDIKNNMDELQRSQADLSMSMQELMQNLMVITGELEAIVNSMDGKKRAPDTGYTSTGNENDTRETNPKPESSRAKELYDMAYKDYSKGNFSLAVMGFDEMLKRYPGDPLVPQARYWLGDSYYSQEKWEKAINEFTRLVENHPGTEEERKAKFKKAMILMELNQVDKARKLLDDIIEKYPRTREAIHAKDWKEKLQDR